jgi:hypothetical protein
MAVLRLFIFMLAAALCSQSLLAAEANSGSADAGIETGEPELQQAENEAVAAAETAPVEEPVDEENMPEESPSRFIPTEQISQDLGVSFPVDI